MDLLDPQTPAIELEENGLIVSKFAVLGTAAAEGGGGASDHHHHPPPRLAVDAGASFPAPSKRGALKLLRSRSYLKNESLASFFQDVNRIGNLTADYATVLVPPPPASSSSSSSIVSEETNGANRSTLFLCIGTRRGENASEGEGGAAIIVGMKDVVLLAMPIVPSTRIELKGGGVFGVALGKDDLTYYFKVASLRSMWVVLTHIENLRRHSSHLVNFSWMSIYFKEEGLTMRAIHENEEVSDSLVAVAAGTSSSSPRKPSNGENRDGDDDVGEGGSTVEIPPLPDDGLPLPPSPSSPALPVAVDGNSASTTSKTNTKSLARNASVVGVFIKHNSDYARLFSIDAFRELIAAASSSDAGNENNGSSRRRRYEKPDKQTLQSAISEFVTAAPDPDALSVGDVMRYIQECFGTEVVGRRGYSKPMIDKIIYTVFGQLEPPSQIIDRLYLGSEYNAANRAELHSLGISHVLNVTAEVDRFFPEEFTYHQVNILDEAGAQLLPYLDRTCDFIETGLTRGTGVIVHCQRGVSRSASVVVAYIMRSRGLSAEDAIALVKERRPIVKPNAGFKRQLKEWGARLPSSAASLGGTSGGVLNNSSSV